MAHTPGPWECRRDETRAGAYVVIAADPSEHALPGDEFIIADFLTESNATLIAAAPDMYDALSDLVQTLFANDSAEAEKARKALRKAQGRGW